MRSRLQSTIRIILYKQSMAKVYGPLQMGRYEGAEKQSSLMGRPSSGRGGGLV